MKEKGSDERETESGEGEKFEDVGRGSASE
jgi:hypothetical protein